QSRYTLVYLFLNAPPTTDIYPLSLHDALPIFRRGAADHQAGPRAEVDPVVLGELVPLPGRQRRGRQRAAGRPDVGAVGRLQELRSEEHTSELQSRGHLVCRLLLEKKKLSIFAE